jgi:hypothetical protein
MRRLLRLSLATASLVLVLLAGLLGMNLWTYHRLGGEQLVAELHFSRTGQGSYRVRLDLPDAPSRSFQLQGDDWQLDVRMIAWQPWLQLLGRDPLYRLDRLSGRYRDIEQARTTPPSVYALSENPGLDLWALAREGRDWLPGIDAVYGSAVYLPMRHQAAYRITLSQKGLLVRPNNDQGRTAISHWY